MTSCGDYSSETTSSWIAEACSTRHINFSVPSLVNQPDLISSNSPASDSVPQGFGKLVKAALANERTSCSLSAMNNRLESLEDTYGRGAMITLNRR